MFTLLAIFFFFFLVTLPFALVAAMIRGRKQHLCLRCKTVFRWRGRYRCPVCYSQDITPVKSPAAQQVMAGSVTPPVTPFVPSAPRPRRSKIALYLLLIFGVPAAIWFIVYAANTPTSAPTTPAATTAESAQPATNGPAANPLALSVTLNLSRIENTDQGPILTVETNLPPKVTLMATIGGNGHAGQAERIVPANHVVQFGPFSMFSISKTGSLSPGVYFLEVDMEGTAEADSIFGEYWQGLTGPAVITTPGTPMKMVSQMFHFKINPDGSVTNPFPEPAQPAPDNSTAESAQPEFQQSAPPEAAPALSFQPSPESTDVIPAPVASQQETSGSPSAPQATEVTPGQTPDQVVAILGPPISITTGATPVYNYPHLSILFARGKVWKIHRFQ